MAIFSDLELMGIMNEANKDDDTFDKFKDRVEDNIDKMKDTGKKMNNNLKNNLWVNKRKQKKKLEAEFNYEDEKGNKVHLSNKNKKPGKITFKEDADGNIIDCIIDGESIEEGKHEHKFELKIGDGSSKKKKEKVIRNDHYEDEWGIGKYKIRDTYNRDYIKYEKTDDESVEEGLGLLSKKNMKKVDQAKRDLTNKAAVEFEKEKQEWESEPGAKTGEVIGDVITGGNVVNTIGKKTGRFTGSVVDKVIAKKNRERKKIKEEADNQFIYRSPEYTKAMNEFFDITDTETRKMLLAVNEADQNKVLVSLTSKLYDNVVDKVDDIDFGEIEMTKGDIEKLPNYNTLHECLINMRQLLIEFKQDTKPVDTITECIANLIDSKHIWTKAYAVNAELPMITYNTMVLAVIEATSYMVSMCVEFIKSPSQDTMQVMIDKSALTKSKGHMLFKNIDSFNSAYNKGQVEKAMMHVIDESAKKKNFIGIYTGIGVGAAVVGIAGLLFCIIPIIRELIFLFYYNRVRVSDFFEVQADLLQINAYNVENNRLDLTKEERKNISSKQLKVAEKFRAISRSIAVQASDAENKASKEIKKEDSKKYKASDVMEELPDSAASSSALF